MEKRYYIVAELVTTEKNYAHKLGLFLNDLISPLIKHLHKNKLARTEKHGINFNVFFLLEIQLTKVYQLAQEFLKILTKDFGTWQSQLPEEQCIGTRLLNFFPYFKMYGNYVTIYNEALCGFSNLKQNQAFAFINNFINKIMSSAALDGLSVESLLIEPVQRLPRYKLLLKSLIESTSEEHKDYKKLTTAALLLEKIIESVQTIDKLNENRVICSKIANFLCVSNFSPKRFFLGRVILVMEPFKTFESRVIKSKYFNRRLNCFLFNDFFVLTLKNKILFRIDPKTSTLLRSYKQGWKENVDGGFREDESKLKFATKRTNIILKFENAVSAKEFYIVFNKVQELDFDGVKLEQMAHWAIKVQQLISESKVIKVVAIVQELKEMEVSSISTSFSFP